ncbi:MAG: hypothetical protein IT435_08915 [Phycisphaerales bacterium]|nr:hypothetical protein [Phycisphaerales bacterium]
MKSFGCVKTPAMGMRTAAGFAVIGLAGLSEPASAQGVRTYEALDVSPASVVLWQPVTQREADPSAKPASRDLEIRLRGEGELGMKSDFDGDTAEDGDVSVSRLRAGLEVSVPIGERSNLEFTLDNEWSFYDFSEPSAFGAMAPWDDTWERGIRIVFSTQETEKFAWFVGADVTAASEYGADFGDSVTYGGLAGVRYSFSENFTAGLGIYARSRLEDDFLPLPMIAFLWKFAPEWSLSSQNGRSVRLGWQVSEPVSLFAEGGYEAREYRLDDDGPSVDGIGKDRRVPVALGARWQIAEGLTLTGKAGAYVWQRYRLDEEDGTKIDEFEAEPAAFFVVELRWVF